MPPAEVDTIANEMMMWKTKLLFSSRKAPSTTGIADDRLRVAAERFNEFRAKLKYLDTILRRHLQDLSRTAASRALVVQALSDVSRNSPIYGLVGGGTEDASSYAALQAKAGHEASAQLERYENEIVKYVSEWETTTTTRVATELKHIQNLYRTMERYRQTVNNLKVAEQKKKKVKPSDLEKISWNESKLRTAVKEYRRNLIAVTLLTEEVTERGWKDMVPLMTRMIDLDIHSTSNATIAEVVEQLSDVRQEIVELGQRFEMDFEAIRIGRLRVLLEEDAIDFVDPGELRSIEESTVVGPVRSTGTTNPTGSSNSNESSSQAGEEEREEANDAVLVQPPIEEAKEKQLSEFPAAANGTPELEEEDEESVSGPNYPKSIYMTSGRGVTSNFNDDETTLTGDPDMVSV